MKQLFIMLLLIGAVLQNAKANEYTGEPRHEAGYNRCVEEVERQHSDDKTISVKEYNEMVKECAFEWQVNGNKDNFKSLLPDTSGYKPMDLPKL